MTPNALPKSFTANSGNWPALGDAREIASIMGGRWTEEPQFPITSIRHRLDLIEDNLEGFLFIPELFARLHGTKARSALLASVEAVAKGAVGLIVTARPRNLKAGFPCLIVADPGNAIRKFAAHQRANSNANFVSVTGSVGKTTTKNMVYHLASVVAPAHRSIANYNTGVESIRFTLSSLSPWHRLSTAEFNEIRDLEEQTELYQPNIAIITNILWEHVDVVERQGYPGPKAIPRLAYLAAGVARAMRNGGLCILNADEPNFDVISGEIRNSLHVELRTFGRSASNDIQIINIAADSSGSDMEIMVGGKRHKYRLGLPGKHMAVNSVAAATAIHFAGIDLGQVLHSFKKFQPEERRGVRKTIPWKGGSITVRDETFSSSIPSLRSSFVQLQLEQPASGGRRIAVLGQVGDLGLTMPKAMAELAAEAEKLNIDRFYTIGGDTRILNENFCDRNRIAPHFQTLAQLERALKAELEAGDTVLLKGSDDPIRDFSLNRFVDRLGRENSSQTPKSIQHAPVRRLIIGGDTYFGEWYQEKRTKGGNINYLETFGYDYSGARIAPLFTRADFAIANLECALTKKSSSGLVDRKDFVLRGKPAETSEALRKLNVGAVPPR